MARKLLTLALCALLGCVCLSAGLFAAAADLDYTGVIDPESGEPAAEGSEGSDRSALSGSMYYDWHTYDYVYPVSDSLGQVHSSAADGMVLTTPVSVKAENGASIVVYADGTEYTGDLTRISAPGEYQVSAQVDGQNRRLFTFTLVGSSTNAIHTFQVPDGFYITEALKDGESVYLDRFSVSMEEEGDYEITYEYPATDYAYTLKVRIDRTAPELLFQGTLDRRGRIRSRLDFSGLEAGDSIYLTRSGVQVAPVLNGDGTGTIFDTGIYRMLVTDSAGNTAEYNFIILQYLNIQGWLFFLILGVTLVTVIIYLALQRRRLKIG